MLCLNFSMKTRAVNENICILSFDSLLNVDFMLDLKHEMENCDFNGNILMYRPSLLIKYIRNFRFFFTVNFPM